jgi:O-antigen ligase
MSDVHAADAITPAHWRQLRVPVKVAPKFSILFFSGLFAAIIPLAATLYWVALPLAPEAAGSWLRIAVLACSLPLAFIWHNTPSSYAERNLIRVLGMAGLLLLIPVLTATNRSHALAGWLKTLVLFTICCFVARGLRHRPTARALGIALLAGAGILVVFLLYIYVRNAGFTMPTYKMARELKGLEQTEYVSLNSVAFTAVLSYLAGFCLVGGKWLPLFFGVPLFIAGSVFSGSRAPLAILAAAAFVQLCINGLRSKSILLWVATALLSLGAVLGGVATLTLASDKNLTDATEGRWHLWSAGLQKFAERPLSGYGYESWRDDLVSRLPGETGLTLALSRKFGGGYHNEYISILAEEGLIGMTAAVLIIWLLLRSSWLLAFRQWTAVPASQWPLFACLFLLLRANFEVPGLFGYGQDPVDYLSYILAAIIISRFSVEEDYARLTAQKGQAVK